MHKDICGSDSYGTSICTSFQCVIRNISKGFFQPLLHWVPEVLSFWDPVTWPDLIMGMIQICDNWSGDNWAINTECEVIACNVCQGHYQNSSAYFDMRSKLWTCPVKLILIQFRNKDDKESDVCPRLFFNFLVKFHH